MNMVRKKRILFVCIAAMVLCSCGGGASIEDELARVPGLCFLHVHISSGLAPELIPEQLEVYLPPDLLRELLQKGDLGVSLLGVDLTDLSPQLLLLTRSLDSEEMARIGAVHFDCRLQETRNGYDLTDSRGSLLGSTAEREGWTCLITGSGADRAANRWLEMEPSGSLAADSDLVAVSDYGGDISVLVSRNSISFLSVIPTGMMTRSEIRMLNRARDIIQTLELRSLRLGIDADDENGLYIDVRMVRGGGAVTGLSLNLRDTEFTPADLIGGDVDLLSIFSN